MTPGFPDVRLDAECEASCRLAAIGYAADAIATGELWPRVEAATAIAGLAEATARWLEVADAAR